MCAGKKQEESIELYYNKFVTHMIKTLILLLSYLFLRQEGIEPPVQPHFGLCIDGRVACYHYTIGAQMVPSCLDRTGDILIPANKLLQSKALPLS